MSYVHAGASFLEGTRMEEQEYSTLRIDCLHAVLMVIPSYEASILLYTGLQRMGNP